MGLSIIMMASGELNINLSDASGGLNINPSGGRWGLNINLSDGKWRLQFWRDKHYTKVNPKKLTILPR